MLSPLLCFRFDRIASLESDIVSSTKKPNMELCSTFYENIFALFGYVYRLQVTDRVSVINLIY
jgi:hypothetical protein